MTTFDTIKKLALGAALFASIGCGMEQAPVDETDIGKSDVVYGTDNRMDVYAHPDSNLQLRAQKSTVALMESSSLKTVNGNVSFNAQTLGTAYDLCSTERFRADPTAAFCSGTLIDDDLVLTAGHCVTNASDCSSTRFVFNYYRTGEGSMATVTSADVFSCSSIVVRKQTSTGGQELDYAIIRLDRAATPRFTPAPVRAGDTAMTTGQNVAVIGSGSGIPFKIDSGGKVRDPRASIRDYFEASTDTFGGNSGSGVYETSSYKVVGILVRGDTDYVAKGSCNVVNVCSESGCGGEGITYVARAVEAYCASNTSARLCGSATEPTDPTPTDPTTPTDPPATTGEVTENINDTVAKNAAKNYGPFAVTAGTTFSVVMSGSGDPDLYVRFGSAPTTSTYDCRPYKSGAAETCTLTVPAGKTSAYVMVRGYSAATYTLAVTHTGAAATQPTDPTDPTTPATPTVQTTNFGGNVAKGGSASHGPLTVVPGSTFTVVMSGTGDPDLYVRFGAAPTTSTYDCRPYLNGAAETCTVTVPAGKTSAYLMVRGYTAATYSLDVTYTAP